MRRGFGLIFVVGEGHMFRRVLTILGAILLAGAAHADAIDASDGTKGAASASAQASPTSQEMLSRLVGRWVLTGTIAGEKTVHDVEATWVLQRNYVRINETSREKDGAGQPKYEATIFVGWLEKANRYVCIWLDNTEVASGEVSCYASQMADSIPLEFRDANGTLIFTNTFVYHRAEDAWEWKMANVRDGQTDVFGMVWLRRR
jgi:hypothetical protein